MLEKISNWYKGLPDKKRYIEFITALLTIPVLISVIIVNWGNLTSKKVDQKQEPPKEQSGGVTVVPIEIKTNQTEKNNATEEAKTCKKEVGPVEIVFPQENQTVDKNPLCIDISSKNGEYCASVWSYRINGGNWSDYTDKSICLYSLDPGDKKLELKVKSIASGDEKILERNFTYKSNNPTSTPIPTQSATNSATL